MADFPTEDTPVQEEQSHRISWSPRAVATSFARHQQVVLPMILLAVILLTCTLSSGIVIVLFVTAAAVPLYSCIHRECITSFLEFLEYLEWNNLDANYTDDRGGDSMVSALSEESKQKQTECISAFLICRELLQYDSSVFASPDEGVNLLDDRTVTSPVWYLEPTLRTLYWFSAPLGTEETSAKIKNSSGSNDDESNDGLQPATATDYRSSAESSEAAGAAARGEHNDDDTDPCTPEIIQLSETTVPIDIETEIVIKEQAMASEECRDDDGDVKKNNKSSISTFYMVSNEGDGDICCVVCKDDDGLLNGQGASTANNISEVRK